MLLMECHYHPEREGTDICAICGKSICKECNTKDNCATCSTTTNKCTKCDDKYYGQLMFNVLLRELGNPVVEISNEKILLKDSIYLSPLYNLSKSKETSPDNSS